jgi:1-deoxyxylulose-5-phosphate synthase
MKYTRLGRSGLRVSQLGLGCMSYGTSKWRSWVLDEDAAKPFFRRAIELGINFFDTADMYSDGGSEEVTGRALREYGKRDELVIATKVFFPVGKGPNRRGLSKKHIIQGCEASLKRLGVDYIDLYQVHRFDPECPLEETLAALDQLVQQGKVLYLGASTTHAYKFAKALYLADAMGAARFVSMQNHYNLIYREEEREMNPLCQSEGVGLIPWSPLARGLLAGARTQAAPFVGTKRAEGDKHLVTELYDHPGDWKVIEENRRVAAARGVTPAETALAWVCAQPGVCAPIIGATKMEHLEAAVKSLSLKLTPEETKSLEAPYEPHAVRGWM